MGSGRLHSGKLGELYVAAEGRARATSSESIQGQIPRIHPHPSLQPLRWQQHGKRKGPFLSSQEKKDKCRERKELDSELLAGG